MRHKSMFTYMSSTKGLRSMAFFCCLLMAQLLYAQEYVKTETAKQKEELEAAAKANKPKKLVYADYSIPFSNAYELCINANQQNQ